jgi:hypothetical protein
VHIVLAVLILGAVFAAVLAVSVAVAVRGLSADPATDRTVPTAGRDGLIPRVAFVALFLLVGGVSLGLVGGG